MPFSMCCARGIFFWHHVWPPVISQQMLAGTTQLAEQNSTVCHKLLSASMLKWNCQFQSGLKIKTIKYTHKYCSPLLQLWLLLPFAPVISPDLDSSNCQNKVILLFLFCPSKTSPNCCKVGVSELLLNNFPVHSFLWADVHPLLFAFNRRPLTCSSNILQIMIMVNVCFYHCTTHFSCHPFVFEALCLSFLFLNVYILLWKRRTGWSSSVSHGQPELF